MTTLFVFFSLYLAFICFRIYISFNSFTHKYKDIILLEFQILSKNDAFKIISSSSGIHICLIYSFNLLYKLNIDFVPYMHFKHKLEQAISSLDSTNIDSHLALSISTSINSLFKDWNSLSFSSKTKGFFFYYYLPDYASINNLLLNKSVNSFIGTIKYVELEAEQELKKERHSFQEKKSSNQKDWFKQKPPAPNGAHIYLLNLLLLDDCRDSFFSFYNLPSNFKYNQNYIYTFIFPIFIKNGEIDLILLKQYYKFLSKKYHPDLGGSNEKMSCINFNYQSLIKQAS